MTNEEFEQKMEFIVEQQAQFASDIQQLQEGIRQLREAQAQTEQLVGRLANATWEGYRDVNAKIAVLVDSQARLTEAQSRTDQNLKDMSSKLDALVDSQIRLTEAQSRTDENLRKLSATVARYLRERRNGKSRGKRT
jgi:predicted nuclease with TOPRIM domain